MYFFFIIVLGGSNVLLRLHAKINFTKYQKQVWFLSNKFVQYCIMKFINFAKLINLKKP